MLTTVERARLWARIDTSPGPDSCWPWSGAKNRWGYPQVCIRKKQTNASRHVLSEKIGRDLVAGEQALHSCDNPGCLNPAHLRVGSAADNMRDKVDRGRQTRVRGEQHGHARLTATSVGLIRRRRANGEPLAAIAQAFGVSKQLVCDIAKRRRWGHVP